MADSKAHPPINMSWLCRLSRTVFVSGLVLIGTGGVEAAPNLAEGASYIYTPPALYDLTRDEGDATQLTDGKLAPDPIWTSRKAVGWLSGATPIEIEIDLGSVQKIGSVCLRSARRAEAGVFFPRRVDVFASAERVRYAWVGNLMADQEAGDGPYLAKRFCSGAFQHDARYVRLLVASKGAYFFTDEIEVWPPTTVPSAAGTNVITKASLALSELKGFALEHEAVSRMVAGLAASHPDATTVSKFSARLQQVSRGLGDGAGALGLKRLAELEGEMWQAVREERAARQPDLDVRLTDPWRLSLPIDSAPLLGTAAEIDLPQGGHGSIAFAVEHAEEQPLRVHVTANVLGGNKDALRLNLYEVAMVTRADGVRQGDPLLPLRDGSFEVASGQSRQLWLDVAAPVGTSGKQVIRVVLTGKVGARSVSRVLDVPLRVWAVPLPAVVPSTVVWGYLDSPPIRGLSNVAAADMLAHGVSTAVLPAADLPWPKANTAAPGGSVGDYSRFDTVMASLKGHRQYLFFLAFNSDSGNRTFGKKHVFLSDSWKLLFSEWMREWSSRLKQSGIGYEAFALYPVDEPHKGSEQKALIEVARLIKAVDPKIRVYTTLHQPEVLTGPLIEVVDIFQLNGPALEPAIIARLKNRDKQVWAYSTLGGGKAGNPAGFYRAQAWEAFSLGLTGFGFWSYADVGRSGTAWNDTDDERPDYAVIYEGNPGIVSSKRWEAWREGVQDFSLLSSAMANAHTEADRNNVKALAIEGHRVMVDLPKLMKIRRQLFELSGVPRAASLAK